VEVIVPNTAIANITYAIAIMCSDQ
jgi:hypothetical protein